MYKLATAQDLMERRLPFWPQDYLVELATGAKTIMVPPTAKLEEVIVVDLMETNDWVIVVGEDAQVVIKEKCAGKIAGAKVKVILENNAKATYIVDEVDPRGDLENVSFEREAILAEGSEIDWFGALVNQTGYLSKVKSWLRGQNARSDMHWLQFAKADERVDIELVNCFDAPNCTGEIFIKAVAQNQARVKVTGGINITLQGTGTDSYLKEDTLLLDKDARIRALPCLEIKTNDVKAGHGATVTNVTGEDMFYLQSRGIDSAEAKIMMVEGFLKSALTKCPDSDLLDKVMDSLALN